MPKGEYGSFKIEYLNEAFRDTHDQHNAYKFGVELADKVNNGKISETEIDERIDKACNKNPHWNRPYVQYGYDFEYEYNNIGKFIAPPLPGQKCKLDIDKEMFPITAELYKSVLEKK